MAINVNSVTPLMQVLDMRHSVAWYCDVLGFEVMSKHEPDGHLHWAMLRLGEALVMLNSKYEDDAIVDRRVSHVEGHRDLTLYFSCNDVDAVYQLLKSKGCDVAEPVNRYYGMRQVTVADPDGYELCFQMPIR